VKRKIEILNNSVKNNADRVQNPVCVEKLLDIKVPSAQLIISKQFSDLFNSYAQAINKANNRTGRLFEEPFRRILVNKDAYFTELIYYIHQNPQRHGFVNDFRIYPHSSYHAHLSNALTKLKREEVLQWFGNENEFEKFHKDNRNEVNFDKFIIDFD